MKADVPLTHAEIYALMQAIYAALEQTPVGNQIGRDTLIDTYATLDAARESLLCVTCHTRPAWYTTRKCQRCGHQDARAS